MFYITGDTHGSFERVVRFCTTHKTSVEDVLIILGDAGINYYVDRRDTQLKTELSKLPITLFCIHGNHEERPGNIPSYVEKEFCGGVVWVEPEFPNLLFAKDGEIYSFADRSCLVIGGAYSVDKEYRLMRGWHWFKDEQPSQKTRERVESFLAETSGVDVILTHTCPLKYEPTEMFLPGIDQSTVDRTTEVWLDSLEDRINYDCWFCGHYHTDKVVDRIRFMFRDILSLDEALEIKEPAC